MLYAAQSRPPILPMLAFCLLAVQSETALAATFGSLKTAQQFRTDAALYDQSIKAIDSIAATRITTAAELKSAAALLQKHSPNLALGASRLVALGLDDRRFATAIAANLANEDMAADFARRLAADYRIVLRFDGAADLQARMAATLQANAATYQRAIDSLGAASLRITGRTPAVQAKFFAPPPSSVWTPASTVILAAIAYTFPSIAVDAPALRLPTTGGTSTNPFVPSAASIAAYMSAIARLTAQQSLTSAFGGFELQQELYDAVRETVADAQQAAVDGCVERARVVFEKCVAAIATTTQAEQDSARSSCEMAFTIARGMCSVNPNYGSTGSSANGSLFGLNP